MIGFSEALSSADRSPRIFSVRASGAPNYKQSPKQKRIQFLAR
jgi:hypothetical protein